MAGILDENLGGGISFTSTPFSFGSGQTVAAPNGGYNFDLPLATIAAFANSALSYTQNNSDANRAFFSGVVGQSQSNVTQTAGRAFDYQQQTLSLFSTINKSAEKAVSRPFSSGCFITTAICRDTGKPDDCEELQALRKFRDTYMQSTPEMRECVREYYRIAPAIVEAIDKRDDRREIYALLRECHLRAALTCIAMGANEMAFVMYRRMVADAALFVEV